MCVWSYESELYNTVTWKSWLLAGGAQMYVGGARLYGGGARLYATGAQFYGRVVLLYEAKI